MSKKTDALSNWHSLNVELPALNETQVLALLEHERVNMRRKVFLVRLHQRWSALRIAREREELMKLAY